MNPFTVARESMLGSQEAIRNQRDTSAIDEILGQAQGASRQQDLDALLAQVISRVSPERQKEPLALLQNQQNRLSQQQQLQRQELQRRTAAKQFGLPEDMPMDVIKEVAKQRNKPPSATPQGKFQEGRQQQVLDFYNEVVSGGKEADNLLEKLTDTERVIQGDVAGPGVMGSLKSNPYTSILTGLTPDEKELQTLNKYLLEGTKGIFGSRPTEREIYTLLQQFMPAIGNSKEANMRSVQVMKKAAKLNQMARDVIQSLTKGGTVYVPDLEDKMHEAIKSYTEDLRSDLKQMQADDTAANKTRLEAKDKPKQAATPQNFVQFALDKKKKEVKKLNEEPNKEIENTPKKKPKPLSMSEKAVLKAKQTGKY